MAAWSDGYFTDVQYTAKFFGHLTPARIAFACLRQGVRPPEIGPGATYLELGCGQGFNLNLIAAANPAIDFWGLDFHPGQIANARRLAKESGLTNVRFDDLSFEQLLAQPDGAIPRCDIIALHGVYSWVSPENRALIVRILDRHLKPGGAVIVTYNALPAWAPMLPVQRFVKAHFDRGAGEPKARARAAFQAVQDMIDRGAPGFAGERVAGMVKKALAANPAYLIHEYFNDHFHALYHAEVARELEGARLTFAASASIAEDWPSLAAPEKLRGPIENEADPIWRETLLDHANGKQFRRDIFVRGRNALSVSERERLLGEVRFTLLKAPTDVSFAFDIPIGKLTGDPKVYGPVIDALVAGPKRYSELSQLPALTGAPEGQLMKIVGLLIEVGAITPADYAPGDAKPGKAFNRRLLDRFLIGESVSQLAAPAAGTGVPAGFADLLALATIGAAKQDRAALARRGWEILRAADARLEKDGQALSGQAEHEAELIDRLERFEAVKLPLYQRLGVI